jgi:hypothetical protein
MTRMIRGMVLLAACVGLWSCTGDPTADQAGVPEKIVSLPSLLFLNVDSTSDIGFQLVDALDGQIPAEFTITNTSSYFDVTVDSMFRPVYNPDGVLVVPPQPTEIRATVKALTAGKDSFLVEAGGKSLYIPVQVIPNLLDATFSSLTPGLSDTVTITAPANVAFTPTSVVTFPGAATASYQIGVDPAGSWIKVFVAANTHASAQITNVTLTSSPTLRFTYRTTDTVTAQTLTALPASFSTLTPAGTPVTMTANAGFKFDPTSAVSFAAGQTAPIINSRTDSSAINFSVAPNVNSTVRVTKVHAINVPQIVYTLASAGTMTSPVVTSFTGAVSNAAPAWGDTVVVSITGGGYKFSPTSAVSWGATKPAYIVSRAADSSAITVIPMPGSSGVPSVTLVTNASYAPFSVTLPGSAGTSIALFTHSSTAAIATAPLVGNAGFYYDAGSFGASADCADFSPCQIYKINGTGANATFTVTWSNTTDLGLYFMDGAGALIGPPANPWFFCDSNGNGATNQPETCTVPLPAGTNYLELDNFGPAYPGGAAANPAPVWVGIKIN